MSPHQALVTPYRWKRQPGKPSPKTPCPYCHTPMSAKLGHRGQPLGHSMTRHHVIPRRSGGTGLAGNIRWCCHLCNQTLALFNDCPGALACATTLGEALGFGKGTTAARGFWHKRNREKTLAERQARRAVLNEPINLQPETTPMTRPLSLEEFEQGETEKYPPHVHIERAIGGFYYIKRSGDHPLGAEERVTTNILTARSIARALREDSTSAQPERLLRIGSGEHFTEVWREVNGSYTVRRPPEHPKGQSSEPFGRKHLAIDHAIRSELLP